MTKKQKASNDAFETPDYEALKTIDDVEGEIVKHKDILVGKDKVQWRIKDEKSEYNAAMNKQLKELEEEREHELGVLGALEDRKKQLSKVVPIRSSQAS